MNIIDELREEARRYDPKSQHARSFNRFANTLEQYGALVPVPNGGRCLLRHAPYGHVLADDGNIYRKEDGDWWSLHDPFQYLVGLDMFVQPVRLVPLKEWEA